MNDHELLKLAAKTAGAQWSDYPDKTPDHWIIKRGSFWVEWNPLTDYGDALQLAAKKNLSICYTLGESAPPYGTVMVGFSPWESTTPIAHERYGDSNSLSGDHEEKMKATCRAITRAAAELSKSE